MPAVTRPAPAHRERPGEDSASPLLRVTDLTMHLVTQWGRTRAVDGVSFDLRSGETLGIVGESGSGKTMLGLSLVRLMPQPEGEIVRGSVELDGVDLMTLGERQMRQVRGRKISMIFQDPQQSLNPVFTVGNQLAEAIRVRSPDLSRSEVRERAIEALEGVNIKEPERRLSAYPHELSGGMKQRVVGAMAMIYRPQVLVADEPTTALDVTIQAQFLQLLREMQADIGVSMILITHDLSVVADMCHRVAVMYAGRIVEQGPVRRIFDHPRHPYTRALLEARPRRDVRAERLVSIRGQPPALSELPGGCRFAPRCEHAVDRCHESYPDVFDVGSEHVAACWRAEEQPWANR